MAINPQLLISAAILQDYFSDNATDAAMSAGVITCFRDNSRTTLKNWYYQTGSPNNYNYLPLPNPLTLSAAGTITDPQGNDTIPFWYPFSELDNETPEPYYVTVDNSNGQRQFTRQNFPYNPNAGSAILGTATLRNLIVNNVFWRNQGTVALTSPPNTFSQNGNTLYYQTLAPSQHDGFISNMADIQFIKNTTSSSADVATFTTFTNASRLNGDATPEFYLNMSCANSGTSETVKYIQIPICLHVDNLSGYPNASVTIWTQNVAGSANNKITLSLYQFLGTGATSPTASVLTTINPSASWNKTTVEFAFPEATLPPGGAGDDGWFLQIGFPVGAQYNMNIAKPSVYLSTVVPADDFDTYECVSGTIDSPRTGDIRTSLNQYQPYGWVVMNDSTICNAGSISPPAKYNVFARQNIDTWPLFSLIWNQFKAYDSGGINPLAQMYDHTGATVGYGATAIEDFNALNQLALTKMMGQVVLGGTLQSTNTSLYQQTVTASNSGGDLLLTAGQNLAVFNGMPIYFFGFSGAIGGIVTNTIYYVSNFNGTTTFNVALSFADAIAKTVIAFSSGGTNTVTVASALAGTFEGEYGHTLTSAELPNPLTTTAATQGATTTASSQFIGNSATPGSGTIANGGGGNSHNNTQPGIFYNMYMKL